MDPVGRLEGMGKALLDTGKKTAEFFVDIGQEWLGVDDEYESDDPLSLIWGSWKDNILGEQGAVNSLFGIDTKDPETDEYGGGFGGLLFGAIPEPVRSAGNTIITPTFDTLDAIYEYAVDRPVGTLITIAGNQVIDPTDWIKAWNITNSRSMGQAFALSFTNVDWTIKNVEEQYEGTPWFNLLSGAIDGIGNIWLDPANLMAPNKIRKFADIAKRTTMSTDYLVQTGIQSKKYARWKTQVQNIGQIEEVIESTSDRFKQGLGYQPNSGDANAITTIAHKLVQEAQAGRLGPRVKELQHWQARQLAAVINNDAAFDMLIRLWAGDSTVLVEMQQKAYDLLNQKQEGGLIDRLDKLNQPASNMPILGLDGLPLDPIQRDISLRNAAGVDAVIYGPDGLPFKKAGGHEHKIYTFDWQGGAASELWEEAFGVAFTDKTMGSLDLFAQKGIREAADRTGFWFSQRTAQEIDPLGNGGYRWNPSTVGNASKNFIRRAWDDLSPEDKEGLYSWAGIHPNDRVGKEAFVEQWNQMVELDKAMDDAVLSVRYQRRNEAGGTVTPRTGVGAEVTPVIGPDGNWERNAAGVGKTQRGSLDETSESLRRNRIEAQLKAQDENFIVGQGVGRRPSKQAAEEAFDLLSRDRKAALLAAMEGALYWSARFGKPIDLHNMEGMKFENFVQQTVRSSPRSKGGGRGARMDFGSRQGPREQLIGPDGQPIATEFSHVEMDFASQPEKVASYWDYLGAENIKDAPAPTGLFKNREIYEEIKSLPAKDRREFLRNIIGNDKRLTKYLNKKWENIPPEIQKIILRHFEKAEYDAVGKVDPSLNLPLRGRRVPMYAPSAENNKNLPYWARNRWKTTSEMGPDDPFDPWWAGFILEIEATRHSRQMEFREGFWVQNFGTFAEKVDDLPEVVREYAASRTKWSDIPTKDRKKIRAARKKQEGYDELTPKEKAQSSKDFAGNWNDYIEFESDWDSMLVNEDGSKLINNSGVVSSGGFASRDSSISGLSQNSDGVKNAIRAGLVLKRQQRAAAADNVDPNTQQMMGVGEGTNDFLELESQIEAKAEAIGEYRKDLRRGENMPLDPETGLPETTGTWVQGPKGERYEKVERRVVRHLNVETGEIIERPFRVRRWSSGEASKTKRHGEVVIDGGESITNAPNQFAEASQYQDFIAGGIVEDTVIPLEDFDDWAKANGWEIREDYYWHDANTGRMMTDDEMMMARREQSSWYRELSTSEQATAREYKARQKRRGLVIDEVPDADLKMMQDDIFGQLMEGEYLGFPYAATLSMEEEKLRSLARRRDVSVERADKNLDALDDALNRDPDLVMAAAQEILEDVQPGILSAVPTLSRRQVWMQEFVQELGDSKVFPNRVVRLFSEKVPQGIIFWDNVQHAYDQFDRMLRDASRVTNDWGSTKKGSGKGGKAREANEQISLVEYADIDVDDAMARFATAKSTAAKQQIFHETVEKLNTNLVALFHGRIQRLPDSGRVDSWSPGDLTRVLRRQHRRAEKELQTMGQQGRIYGNSNLMVARASEGHVIDVRMFEALTPHQLATSSLVPRYDLYREAFTDLNIVQKSAKGLKDAVGMTSNAFTSVWKKTVLLRPAWPMRVLTDELARNAAHVGTIHALRGFMHGFENLQAGWYKRNGANLGPLITDALKKELGSDYKIHGKWNIDNATPRELLEAVATKFGNDQTKLQKIVKQAIVNDYRKSGVIPGLGRSAARAMGASAAGAFFAGPVGMVAAGGIHALHSRRSLRRLAELETANTMGYTLSNLATGKMKDRIAEIESIIIKKNLLPDSDEYKALVKEAEAMRDAKRMLETQGNGLMEQYALADPSGKRRMKKDLERKRSLESADVYNDMAAYGQEELAENFDMVGKIMSDADVSDYHLGGVRIGNEFGNTPQAVGIWRNAMSADTYGRNLFRGASEAQRAQIRAYNHQQYDYSSGEPFRKAWNDTVNRQWVPHSDVDMYARPTSMPDDPMGNIAERREDAKWFREQSGIPPVEGNPYQDFTRLFWLADVSDDDIVRWVMKGPGASLKESMPAHFARDEHSIREWVRTIRWETDALVPNLPEFQFIRRDMAKGQEVSWEADIQPIINRHFDGDIQKLREEARKAGIESADAIGKVVGDGSFAEAYATGGLVLRSKRKIDEMFKNIGTLPTDELTRSVVFATAYQREVAQRIQALKLDGEDGFIVNQKRLNAIESESRRIALKETKGLLYDLAERTRFEEVMANVMPFFAAYLEVITRWAGIAVRNPEFVLTAGRNFRKVLEGDIWPGDGLLMQTDASGEPIYGEDGEPLYVLDDDGEPVKMAMLRMPSTIFGLDVDEKVPDWVPVFGGEEYIGQISLLKDHNIKADFGSMAMISGGMPGYGPLFGFAASEIRLDSPTVDGVFKKFFPYGVTEGENWMVRLINQSLPRAGTVLASNLFSTNEKARLATRHAQDVIAEWTLNGQVIDSPAMLQAWEDEVMARTQAHLQVRLFGSLAVPFTFAVQSPYENILTGYENKKEKLGLEAADEWLIREHSYLWGALGRSTRVENAASATLEGEMLYQENQEFVDNKPETQDFWLGKVGTLDSQFEYNQTVFRKEIAEGRRVYQTPEEMLRRAQGTYGWNIFNKLMNPINQALDQQREMGLPFSLNADYNYGYLERKRNIIGMIGQRLPMWLEDYNDIASIGKTARVVNEFRDGIDSLPPAYEGKPEIVHLANYINDRDRISLELLNRSQSTGDPDMQTLSHPQNLDLRDEWEGLRLMYSVIPDFQEVYLRYFDNDDAISRNSWPDQLMKLLEFGALS